MIPTPEASLHIGVLHSGQAIRVRCPAGGATRQAKPTITGAKGGNAAVASLLTAPATLGLITDWTTA